MGRKILFRLSVFSVVIFVLSSCATIPQSSLSEFSLAVSLTAENNSAAYAEIERVHHEVELMKAVVYFDSKGFNPDSLSAFFDEQDLKIRKQVLDGLLLYSEKLSELAGNRQLEEFDAETRNLGSSLQNLNEGLLEKSFFKNTAVAPSQIQIFTTAVNAVGRWLIEYKKDISIRESIIGMNGGVGEICILFEQDFGNRHGVEHKSVRGLRVQQWNQYDELMMLQDKFIRENSTKFGPVSKKLEIEKLAALPRKQKESDAAMADVQNSFMKLREIHNSLSAEGAGEKQDYELLLKNLISEGKRIGKFYKSVK